MNINSLKSKINKLNVSQKRELINYIKTNYSVFDEYAEVKCCPYCYSNHIIKNGTRKGITRYLCKDCKKTFTYKSNTILKGIHQLNKWNEFVEDFITLNISSIKHISEKLNVSIQTAINWRHKLLSALVNKENTFKDETIEFDEIFFLISRKGRRNMNINDYKAYKHWRENQVGDSDYAVKVFFTYSREKRKLELNKSHMGRTSVKDLENYFLPNKFENITAITDGHRSYSSYFYRYNVPHKTFKSKNHINKSNKNIHNQTINAYAKGFKDFVNRHLRGVSTKYLDFYAKWYEFMINIKKEIENRIIKEETKIRFNITDKICENVLSDINGLEFFRQSEIGFQRFLKENGRTDYGFCSTHYYV